MSEYNNLEGFEASKKARKYWVSIPKQKTKVPNNFDFPPLFKSVSPYIILHTAGFFFILAIELYATFGVALNEGVPWEEIIFLILLDILFAYLPHLLDESICENENELFLAEKQLLVSRIEKEKDEDVYKYTIAAKKGRLKRRIRISKNFKRALFSLLVGSATAKLYYFFKAYPFYDTYQAYIVMASYSVGGILHIICTGNVLMYWLRFRFRLHRDKNKFNNTDGRENSYSSVNYLTLINSTDEIIIPGDHDIKHNQSIIKKDGKFYLETTGLLFDEELNDLIVIQTNREAQLAIALAGKHLQISQLVGGAD